MPTLVSADSIIIPAWLSPRPIRIRAGLSQGPTEVALDDLLGAYLHMLLNRLLPTEARLHELVLYDFLHRHYQASLARQGTVA